MSAPVLVTGAGGFIGGRVVARLSEAGVPVRAGLRRPGADAVACDLDAPATVEAACAGAGAIVHAAGRSTDSMRDHLRTLLAAADRTGVDRMVLFSSVAVYGPRTGVVSEDDPPAPLDRGDAYGAAKRGCEAMLRAWAGAAPGRRAVILRPGIVYGPGCDLWIARPAAALRAGVLGDLGPGGEGIAALVHVADVAEAVGRALRVLDEPGPEIAAFNIVGPDTPTWNGYFAALAGRIGLGAARALGPGRLAALRALALPAKLLARLGLPVPPRLRLVPAAGELRLFAARARYATAHAETVLGFRAAIGLERGLDASLLEAPARPGYAAGGEAWRKATAKAASAAPAPATR